MRFDISKFRAILLMAIMLLLSSCGKELSPAVSFENVSPKYIHKLRVNWNDYYLIGSSNLRPGQGSSENFALFKKSDLYGPVHLQWENASGKKFTKDFTFGKEELPTYLFSQWRLNKMRKKYYKGDRKGVNKSYTRVEFYFTQDGVKYITSDQEDFQQQHKEFHKLSEQAKDIYFELKHKK